MTRPEPVEPRGVGGPPRGAGAGQALHCQLQVHPGKWKAPGSPEPHRLTPDAQGGVCQFEDDVSQGRGGFFGWMGFGGSVFQWHPELKIGFGYVPTLLTWIDLTNNKARQLQVRLETLYANLTLLTGRGEEVRTRTEQEGWSLVKFSLELWFWLKRNDVQNTYCIFDIN